MDGLHDIEIFHRTHATLCCSVRTPKTLQSNKNKNKMRTVSSGCASKLSVVVEGKLKMIKLISDTLDVNQLISDMIQCTYVRTRYAIKSSVALEIATIASFPIAFTSLSNFNILRTRP